MRNLDFYIPQTKEELIQWLGKYKPTTPEGTVIHWRVFTHKQNLRSYIQIRKEWDTQNAPKAKKTLRDFTQQREPKY